MDANDEDEALATRKAQKAGAFISICAPEADVDFSQVGGPSFPAAVYTFSFSTASGHMLERAQVPVDSCVRMPLQRAVAYIRGVQNTRQ